MGHHGLTAAMWRTQWRGVLWWALAKGQMSASSNANAELPPELLAMVWMKLRKVSPIATPRNPLRRASADWLRALLTIAN